MAYTSRGASAALRGGRNQAALKVSANTGSGAKAFNPTYSFTGTTEVDSSEFVVKANHGGDSKGRPMLIQNFSGQGQSSTATSMENAQFLGICNTGQTVLEIFLEVINLKTLATTVACSASGDFLLNPYITMLLEPGKFISLPNTRMFIFNTQQGASDPHSGATGTAPTSDIISSTDGNGYLTSTDYFSTESAGTHAVTGGITPGTISINFYTAGYQELGMTNTTNKKEKQTPSTSTGLSANTAYEFDITVDGGTTRAVNFTTHTSDVTWGNGVSGNGVLKKINDSLKALHTAGSITSLAQVRIVDGDIRFTSGSRISTSAIALANASGSVANFFSAGIVPAIGNIDSAVASALETAAGLGRKSGDTRHLLIDRGDGTGSRADGGTFKMLPATGAFNYAASSVTIELHNCPKYADFKMKYSHNAGHGGPALVDTTDGNSIVNVFARSVNVDVDGKVKIFTVN